MLGLKSPDKIFMRRYSSLGTASHLSTYHYIISLST